MSLDDVTELHNLVTLSEKRLLRERNDTQELAFQISGVKKKLRLFISDTSEYHQTLGDYVNKYDISVDQLKAVSLLFERILGCSEFGEKVQTLEEHLNCFIDQRGRYNNMKEGIDEKFSNCEDGMDIFEDEMLEKMDAIEKMEETLVKKSGEIDLNLAIIEENLQTISQLRVNHGEIQDKMTLSKEELVGVEDENLKFGETISSLNLKITSHQENIVVCRERIITRSSVIEELELIIEGYEEEKEKLGIQELDTSISTLSSSIEELSGSSSQLSATLLKTSEDVEDSRALWEVERKKSIVHEISLEKWEEKVKEEETHLSSLQRFHNDTLMVWM